MPEPFDWNAVLAFLRSGAAFSAGAARPARLPPTAQAELRDAVHAGLTQAWGTWLFPDAPQWLAAEVCDPGAFDRQGRQQPSERLSGDVRVLRNREWMRLAESGGTASSFSAAVLLTPGKSQVRLDAGPQRGELEVVVELDRPLANHAWTAEQLGLDLSLFCRGDEAVVLDDFATLGRAEWRWGEARLHPRFGVRPPIEGCEAWRSPVAKLISRVQPPLADRFLRIPARAVAQASDPTLRFQVRLGADAARILASLAGRLRINCLPVWNAALGAVERPRRRPDGAWEIDPHPLRAAGLTILDCLDRRTGQTWCDERFAGGRDPACTFRAAPIRPGVVELRLPAAPPEVDWRILYLAQTAKLENIRPGETWLCQDNEHLVACTSAIHGPDSLSAILDNFPEGRIVTEAELVELLWRIMPAPLRRWMDHEALESGAARAIGIRQELRVIESSAGRRAFPVTVVTLPGCGAPGRDEAEFWLEGLAREAERYCSFGEHLEIHLEPIIP